MAMATLILLSSCKYLCTMPERDSRTELLMIKSTHFLNKLAIRS
jgi:hypothetical protein